MAKDLFSTQAALYSQFRPTYPKELFDYIVSFVKEKNLAWDCATGNGQAALQLANYFKKVVATDVSEKQLAQATAHPNIEYSVGAAEQTFFADASLDLITVAQAYHWFDHQKFWKEVYRVGKKESIVAIIWYDRFKIGEPALDEVLNDFYWNVTGPYWDSARKYIDEGYTTLPFPPQPLPSKEFTIELEWTKEQMLGYLSSWSAVQAYIKQHQTSPVDLLQNDVDKLWGDRQRTVRFPLFVKLGRLPA